VVGRDPDSDLAVLKVDPAKVSTLRPVAVGDSTQVKVGQFTVAIGNPFGLEGTMTFGIVSALGRTLPANNSNGLTAQNAPTYTIPDVIQTDAPVNPGNSGGVLLDLDGRLIGVPSAIESPAGTSAGIGFAIPSAIVQQVVPALIQTGRYEHPWIGISGTTLTSEMAGAMGLPATQRGTLVVDVTSGSPADKAGLQGSGRQVTIAGSTVRVGGDVIVAVDGQPVQRFEDLTSYLARHGKVGQTIELKVVRDGKEVTLSLTLAARPAQTSQPRSQNQGQQSQPQGNAWLGVSGVTLTSALAQAMGLPADQKGVLVQDVVQGSPADKAGIRGSDTSYTLGNRQVLIGGDVIVKAGNQSVETIEALVNTVRGQKPGDTLALDLLRDGKEMTLSVTLAVRPTQTP
jgi:S1-C subfamily serine protease